MKKSVITFVASLLAMATIGLSFVSWSKKNVKDEIGKAKTVIPMNTTTIQGDKIDMDVYKENDVTLVNIMATWCGPCIKELPELQEIDKENNGIGVVGVVFDTYNTKTGKRDEKAIKEAINIANKTGVEYPLVIANDDIFNATLKGLAALLPMSFIVNKNGEIIQGPLAGAKSKADWLKVLNAAK